MGPNEFERWIIARTELIVTARLMKQKGLTVMPLEIKGLKGKALKARANIDALNSAYDKFNEAAPAHVSDVESLTSQVTGMQDDLEFAASVLGNSVGESEKLAEKHSDKQVVTAADIGNVAAELIVGQPATAEPQKPPALPAGDQRSFDRLG